MTVKNEDALFGFILSNQQMILSILLMTADHLAVPGVVESMDKMKEVIAGNDAIIADLRAEWQAKQL